MIWIMMDFLSKTAEKKKKFAIMSDKLNYPIRMCIICKDRFWKSNLFRYQIEEQTIVAFSGTGRSFYICEKCLIGDQKRLQKILCNRYNIVIKLDNCGKKLKEIATNGR